jgi:hypothetical protein
VTSRREPAGRSHALSARMPASGAGLSGVAGAARRPASIEARRSGAFLLPVDAEKRGVEGAGTFPEHRVRGWDGTPLPERC